MSASKAIKALGLPSLRYVSLNSDTKESVLYDWYNNKPIRFNVLINGVAAIDKIKRESKSL